MGERAVLRGWLNYPQPLVVLVLTLLKLASTMPSSEKDSLMVAHILSLSLLTKERFLFPLWVSSQASKPNKLGTRLQGGSVYFVFLDGLSWFYEHSPHNFHICRALYINVQERSDPAHSLTCPIKI